ncbi:acyltransferase family protein [Derxia lacustris]|uniref:acyltransferase family protein n=1 Tax=Derxia lacustris TaxID=764842 RepID=UPI001593C630|nr:acyltransferase [Derxia lacustris]
MSTSSSALADSLAAARSRAASSTTHAPHGNFHIPSLDGMRAVAVSIVFLAHAGLGKVVPGGFGVTIFFFLSGFLITTLMRREYEASGQINLRHFYMRRMLRIWPAFYFVLFLGAAAGALGWLNRDVPQWQPLLAQALHVTNYYTLSVDGGAQNGAGMVVGSGVYWSLAVEEHFYLVFPLIFLALQRSKLDGRGRWWWLIGMCALGLAWRVALVLFMGADETRVNIGSDTRFDSLLFGCALAIHRNPALDRDLGYTSRQLLAGVLIGMALIGVALVLRDDFVRNTLRYTLLGVGLYPIFIAAILRPDWLPFRALNSAPARWLGGLSYAVYLVHDSLLYAANKHLPMLPPLARGAVALVASLLLAQFIFRCIERPFGRLRRRFA